MKFSGRPPTRELTRLLVLMTIDVTRINGVKYLLENK